MFGYTEQPSLSFEKLCELGSYELPKKHVDKIKVMIVDEFTAIPYSVITSDIDSQKCNFLRNENNLCRQ